MNDRSCSEAFKKVEEFRVLHNESHHRVKEIERELAKLRAILVEVDMAKNNMVKQLKEKDQKLQSSEEVVAKQAVELDALKAKIATIEKVTF